MTNIVSGKLTVIFDPPFYKGIFECQFDETYQIAQVIFGTSAPTLRQIDCFISQRWDSLNFFNSDRESILLTRKCNPKRLQRLVNKSIRTKGIGTKAQQVLKQQRETQKQTLKRTHKLDKEKQKQLIYQKKQQKRKEKHKGH